MIGPSRAIVSGITLLVLVASAPSALADDGALEINQVCAVQTGCFPGDAAGFPVTLTAPGSYVLTSNLEVVAQATTAIQIQAPGIDLDLNGFDVRGPVTCSDTGSGVTCAPSPTTGAGVHAGGNPRVTVRDGVVHGFNNGLFLSSEVIVEDLIVYDVAGNGIFGGRVVVRDSIVSRTGGNAIDVDRASQITGTAIYQSGGAGLRGRSGATRMEQNLILGSYGPGMVCNTSCTLLRNVVVDGGEDGIRTGGGSWVEANLIHENARDALAIGQDSAFRHNAIWWLPDQGQTGVTGPGIYLDDNRCLGQLGDSFCRFEP